MLDRAEEGEKSTHQSAVWGTQWAEEKLEGCALCRPQEEHTNFSMLHCSHKGQSLFVYDRIIQAVWIKSPTWPELCRKVSAELIVDSTKYRLIQNVPCTEEPNLQASQKCLNVITNINPTCPTSAVFQSVKRCSNRWCSWLLPLCKTGKLLECDTK